VTTQAGKPFSAAGFGNWFRDRCNEAGLTVARHMDCARPRRFAEAGCTMHEIAAITGHASLSEVQRVHEGGGSKAARIISDGKAK
jgi:hypothetical protein